MRALSLCTFAAALAGFSAGSEAQISPGMNPCQFQSEFGTSAECNAATSQGVTNAQQKGTVVSPLQIISDAVGLSLQGSPGPGQNALANETGIAGAPQGSGVNAWVALGKNHVNFSWTPLSSRGNIDSVVLGVDRRFQEKLVGGLSLSFDHTSVDTLYNAGSLTSTGYNVAPYFGWQINEAWSVDGAAGFGKARTDVRDGAGGTFGGTDASRWFGSLNANYTRWSGDWEFSGKGSIVQTREDKDAFVLSNGTQIAGSTGHLGQMRLGGQVGVLAGAGLNPYAGIALEYDYRHTDQVPVPGVPPPANDRTGLVYIFGVNYFSKGAVSGGLRFQTSHRQEQKIDMLLANLAVRF